MTVRDTTEYGYSLNQSQADHGPRSTVHGHDEEERGRRRKGSTPTPTSTATSTPEPVLGPGHRDVEGTSRRIPCLGHMFRCFPTDKVK